MNDGDVWVGITAYERFLRRASQNCGMTICFKTGSKAELSCRNEMVAKHNVAETSFNCVKMTARDYGSATLTMTRGIGF